MKKHLKHFINYLLETGWVIGRAFKVDIILHSTFVIYFIIFLILNLINSSLIDTIIFSLIIFMTYFLVICHEFGHILVARRFNIKAKEILLTPIGGLALFDSFPKDNRQELLISIGGPLVNLVFTFLGIFVWFLCKMPIQVLMDFSLTTFVQMFIIINLSLFIFNVFIPALPMDGGRIFRSLLGIFCGREKATRIAVVIAKIMSIIFMGIGIYYFYFTFILLALFIWWGANAEKLAQEKGL